ncbi:hypothetical protein G6L09_11480 [Agrobacterium rhizogenes]|nr:hypothetical protein [Rhizobium rhizogenes]NTH71175.1 hypothetical protein [Rhizobium rhizogenes]
MLSSTTLAQAELLSKKLPDDFARKVLDGSLGTAWDSANPIRANLFAAGMRELVTYVLHTLAPDASVEDCAWYASNRDAQKKQAEKAGVVFRDAPTRVNRMVYATQGGLSDKYLDELGVDTKGAHKKLRTVVDELSKYTHVRPGSLLEGDAVVSNFMAEALEAMIRFYDVIFDVREAVASAVSEANGEAADSALTDSIASELDELSTHTAVNEVIADDIRVTRMGSTLVEFEVRGTVYVQLNYGSRSDFNRGDGASMSDKYPFSLTMAASVADLRPYATSRVSVDNSSFFE